MLQGYFAEQDEGATPTAPLDPAEQPEEKLAFALGDGRVGILAVKGRKVCCERDLARCCMLALTMSRCAS